MADTRFVDTFNQRLGQYTGRKQLPTPAAALDVDLAATLANLKIAREIEARYKEYESKGGRPKKQSDVKPPYSSKPVYGNLSQNTADVVTGAGDTDSWAMNSLTNAAVFGIGLENAAKNVLGVPVKAGLEGLARIGHGWFGGGAEMVRAQNEGQGFFHSFDDAASQAWKGLSGNQDEGAGEWVEALASTQDSENPISMSDVTGKETWKSLFAIGPEEGHLPTGGDIEDWFTTWSRLSPWFTGPGSNKAAREGTLNYYPDPLVPSPTVQHGTKVAAGVGGEVFLDPLNPVGVKVVGKMAKADELTNFSMDAYRDVAKEAAEDAAKSRGLGTTLGKRAGVSTVTDPITGQKIYTQRYVKDDFLDSVDEAIDNTVLHVGGGATSGRVIGQNLSPQQIANTSMNKLREIHTKEADDFIRIFENDVIIGQKNMSSAALAAARKNNPLIDEYLTRYLDNINAVRTNKFTTIEDALLHYTKNTSSDLISFSNKAAADAKALLDNQLLDYQDDVFKALQGKIYNAPGLRIGSHVLPFNRIGRAYATHLQGKGFSDLKYGDQFIGRTPRISTKVRNIGHLEYENLHSQVQTISKALKLTSDEKVAIQHAILAKSQYSLPPRLATAANWIKAQYHLIHVQEADAGLSVGKEADNYVYNYYRKSSKYKAIKDYKDNVVKFRLARNPTNSLDPNHITDAIKAGLKPEEDAFRALLYRKLTSNRKLTRTWFRDNLLDNYGIMANRLSPAIVNKMRLKKISTLNAQMESLMKTGDQWYLPSDVEGVLQRYISMTGGSGSEEINAFIRLTDNVTRWFKTAATLPWPGFHFRNAIGDLFMSFLDGVRSSDYTHLRKWAFDFGNNPNATRKIGDKDWTLTEIRQIFKENAASAGHQIVDTTDASWVTKVAPTRAGAKARELSERREDVFRFTHFLHAFREEYPKALAHTANKERALANAIDASTYRVNKYLFDYGALTSNESKYLKRIFPFYTYTRKAIPTLVESLFLHPSQFGKTQRWFLEDGGDNSYNDMMTPQYQRDIGYARLSNEDDSTNPWILGGQFLPTDVIKRNLDFSSHSGWLRNMMSQTNPFVKAASEVPGGEKFFNQQEIGGPGGYYASSFLPFIDPLEDLAGPLIGRVPGFGEGGKSGIAERLGSGRIGLGLPFDKVVHDQQTAALYALDQKVEDELSKYNPGLEKNGYKLYLSKRGTGTDFRIRRLSDDKVIYHTTDVHDAIARTKSLSG